VKADEVSSGWAEWETSGRVGTAAALDNNAVASPALETLKVDLHM